MSYSFFSKIFSFSQFCYQHLPREIRCTIKQDRLELSNGVNLRENRCNK